MTFPTDPATRRRGPAERRPPIHRANPKPAGGRIVALALSLTISLAVAGPIGPDHAVAGPTDPDPELEQRIDRSQPVASGSKVLDRGHVDVGPRFVDGRWTVLIHDDAAREEPGGTSVWRRPERTVLRVTDAAALPVPDDPAYGFVGVEPGSEVLVVPQTQDPEVVWIGWNTQDPEVMSRIDRGVTMSLVGVEGPGDLSVYLQSGDFGQPEVLWDSRRPPREVWVDVNTHTHANWVFTEPGTYLVRVRVTADLIDGTTVVDTSDLRFAVGSDTPPADALAAAWSGPEEVPADGGTERAGRAGETEGSSGPGPLPIALAAAALLLAAAGAAAAVRSGRAKRRARGAAGDPDGGRGPGGDA